MGRSASIRILGGAVLVMGLAVLQTGCSEEDHHSFVAVPSYASTWVATGDLNGDGRVDIVSSILVQGGWDGGSAWISTRLQDPVQAGTFLDPVRSDGGPLPARFALARLSPGGLPGVVVANGRRVMDASASSAVSVLFPDPALPGGFLAPLALPVGARNPRDVAVGDLDGDTFPDVVVAADGGNTLLVFIQQAPGGTFGAPLPLVVGGEPTAVAVGDIDGDGLLDIAAATSGGTVSVLLQDPSAPGTFLPPVDYPVGTHPAAVRIADLDGDGRPDILVANYGTDTAPTTQGLSVLLQAHAPSSPGTFEPQVTYDLGDSFASSLAVGDLDGDGRPDVAVACAGLPGYPGSVAVLLQDAAGKGTLGTPVRYGGLQGPTSVALADIDGDGLPDLVIGDGTLVSRHQIAGHPGTFGVVFQYRQ